MFLVVCAVSVQAQTCVIGTCSGTVSKPCYTLDYDTFVADKVQATYSIPSFPNWEVWTTEYGVTYVVLKRKQFAPFTSYNRWNIRVLNLGFYPKDESMVSK